ncbi:oxygenase MpaB family protein [Agromyces sp. LHK192]|uniref:oxygenase MpaB family protein n=1 Tax=Agromyces sp. LHK192 TaxID=2498704 RepID=UPI00196AF5C0|nr:oxygenase MpaB family protein [Agromyces sp. LHK192]
MDMDDGVDDRGDTRTAKRRSELDAIDNSALREAVNWFVLAAGTSNVVMQLSRRPVAYGVMESRVVEGNLFTNPKRRARTTVAYLAVVMLGGPDERAAMRRATNRSHAQVRSEAGAPVAYHAFDPELQTWVAACLFKGAEDAYVRAHGPMHGVFRDEFYRQSMAFGTTLQMPPENWPATRDAFEAYWREQVATLEVDDATREYLTRIVRLEYLGRTLPERVLRYRARLVAGYLPPEFRALMHLPWTDDDQRRFDRFDRRLARLTRAMPRRVRERPLARQLTDVRRRLADGRPLF